MLCFIENHKKLADAKCEYEKKFYKIPNQLIKKFMLIRLTPWNVLVAINLANYLFL